MDESIVIEEPTAADAAALVDYLKTVMGETEFLRSYPDEITITAKEEAKYIERMRSEPNCLSLVARDGNRIVACGGLNGGRLRKFRHAAEFGISVLTEYRGQGIGTEVTKRCIDYARESNVITKLNLLVNADNGSAAALYRKLGFVEEGRITKDWFYDNIYHDSILMGMDVEGGRG